MDFLDNGRNGGATHRHGLQALAAGSAGEIKIATGFVSPKGLATLADAAGDRPVRLVVGNLRTLQGKNHNLSEVGKVLNWLQSGKVRVKWLYSKKDNWNLHAKVWIFENVAVVTSANLTDKGLHTQPEMGIVTRREDRLAWLDSWFEKIWGSFPQESMKLEKLLEAELARRGYSTTRPREYAGSSGERRGGCLPIVGASVASILAVGMFLKALLKRFGILVNHFRP